jgi:type VI secretion system protein VasJ
MSPTESPACAPARSRAELLLRPISADVRAGRDARDDARAELLRDEMLKDGYTRRDWPRVEEAARTLLCDATKDIVVAAFWASAAYETEGLPGLAAGLALLSGLLDDYWDEMFPPTARRKVRESALDNFYEHLAARIPARTVTADDADDLAACTELLESLHRSAQTRYTPAPPPHRPARDALARLHAALPKPAAKPAAPPPAAEPIPAEIPPTAAKPAPSDSPLAATKPAPSDSPPAPPPVARAPASTPPDLPSRAAGDAGDVPLATADPPRAGASVDELLKSLTTATQHLPKIAAGLRRQQPASPLPYLILRVAAWLRPIEPAADPQGRAPIDPLPPATRNQCDAMARAGRWTELLDASESAFAAPNQRFALDLQRHTASSLAGLGHHEAHASVLAELTALLRRMPGLPRLLARDGTPLADPETQAFLARERLTSDLSLGPAPLDLSQRTAIHQPLPSKPELPLAAPSAPVPSILSQPGADLQAARQRLAAGDRVGALAQLQQAVDATASPRLRFDRRIDLALFAHEAGLAPVARAQLSALEREAGDRQLATWEPQLVARVIDPLLAILRTPPRPADAAETQRLFDQLCTLDPIAAARHSPR